MVEQHLHIISFDVPAPPDYGGVIDVYYKAKALAESKNIDIEKATYEVAKKHPELAQRAQ